MCLSGGGTKIAQDKLHEEFKKLDVKYKVFIGNDALASIFTAFKNGKNIISTFVPLINKVKLNLNLGGTVLIAGTGSNCVLVNPLNDKLKTLDQIEYIYAGGWGSVLGDEGSGNKLYYDY